MRLWCSVLLSLSMLPARPAAPGEHLVTPGRIEATLGASASERREGLATLERTLSAPAVEKAAARVGVDLGRVRQALPALTDDEVRDLAARADALESDPAAGLLGTLTNLVILVLLVLLVLLVVQELD